MTENHDLTLMHETEDAPASAPVTGDLWWDELAERLITVVNVAALIAGLVILTGATFPGRSWLAVVLVVFGPGSGLVKIAGQVDLALRWVLVVALSIACTIITAQLLLAIHTVDARWGAAILTFITATGPLTALLSRSRRIQP